MLIRKAVLYGLVAVFLLAPVISCSSAKDIEERRNFMIPKKSEMPRNSRYKEAEKRKTNKHKPSAGKMKSYF